MTNDQGKSELLVAGNARWDKHGSGRKKDSLSGCSVFKLTLGLEPMSQSCIKCAKGTDHDPSICPNNCVGLSKGMDTAPGLQGRDNKPPIQNWKGGKCATCTRQ
jgi:hypothetical protein